MVEKSSKLVDKLICARNGLNIQYIEVKICHQDCKVVSFEIHRQTTAM